MAQDLIEMDVNHVKALVVWKSGDNRLIVYKLLIKIIIFK